MPMSGSVLVLHPRQVPLNLIAGSGLRTIGSSPNWQLSVGVGSGIRLSGSYVNVGVGSGIRVSGSYVSVGAGSGIIVAGSYVNIGTGSGIIISGSYINVGVGSGIIVTGSYVNVGTGSGIIISGSYVNVGAGSGIMVSGSYVNIRYPIVDVINTTTLDGTNANGTILVTCSSANITINLPAVANYYETVYTIKKIDSGSYEVVVDANSTELIDGLETQTISTQWDSMRIHSNGSAWYKI